MHWVSLVLVALAGPPEAIGPAEFSEILDSLVPDHPEKWQAIPWRTELLEARAVATESRKPLFLWSMNGHPLGCT